MLKNNTLKAIVLAVASLLFMTSAGYPVNAQQMNGGIHTIEIIDEHGQPLNITNSSETVQTKQDFIAKVNQLPTSPNTQSSIIQNVLMNDIQIINGSDIAPYIIADVNAINETTIHLDFIVLNHVFDAHQFAVIHGAE
jgi:hypothetical protein